MLNAMTNQDAFVLRENTGTTGVLQTARAAAATLADFGTPHLVVGGIAVQEHGYPRVTIDVDIVVPDVLAAVDELTADLGGRFIPVQGFPDRVQDRQTGVQVDLLPGGRVLKHGCKVPFPLPTKVTSELQIIGLEGLISLKLDSWVSSPQRRLKDKADVNELILRRNLSRDLSVAPAVREVYLETWDALQAEV
jgi:hypothetical protein